MFSGMHAFIQLCVVDYRLVCFTMFYVFVSVLCVLLYYHGYNSLSSYSDLCSCFFMMTLTIIMIVI